MDLGSGLLIWAAAAALGLAAALRSSRCSVRRISAYLIFLAVQALHSTSAGIGSGSVERLAGQTTSQVWLDQVTAAVFLGFGVRLAADTNS